MPIIRIFVAFASTLIALLAALPSQAAVTLADRSPFTQGTWWNPARSGNGFEIFSAGDQVSVGWYTFEESGRAIWYTAQGALDTMGTQSWPLLQHRWVNGRRGEHSVVGSLRLTLRHAEAADVAWEIRGQRGTWPIQPFIVSGVINEIDHGGTWFDPANGGWGLTLTEQGNIFGGGLFTYDASGEPTWAAGFSRGAHTVEYFVFSGACPACPYRAPTSRSVGNLSFEFRTEVEATVRSNLSLVMAPGVNVDGARVVQLSRPASMRAADRQLASFHSELALKAFLDAGMMNVPSPSADINFSSPPPSIPYSPTNLQESGVDEADLVKSDGRFIYTYAHSGNGARQPIVRIAEISNDGTTLDVRGSVTLASGSNTPVANAGLFLHRDNLVSVTGTQAHSYFVLPWVMPGSWIRGVTHVEVLNVATPGMPVTRWRAEIDGHVISSRRIGDRLYVVTRFVPYLERFVYGYTSSSTLAANQQLLTATPLSGLLPKLRINGGEATAAVTTAAIYAPPQGERKVTADMVLVTAIDLDGPRIAQTLAIIGSADTIYVSTANLFIAGSRNVLRSASGVLLPVEPSYYLTDIHQIRLTSDAMSIVGSASIEGFLGTDAEKAAFRLSDYQGRLRAVTSSSAMWGGDVKNRLTILEPSIISPGLLKTVSYLPNAQRPQSIGKPNEILYGTRFLADRLYAVTFKKIDPLYVIDLADSTDPRIAGELELPGFSDYLHPLPNGLLLGFGKDARPAGVNGDGQFAWFQGLQLTLFDVRDIGQPRQIQTVLMGKRGSESALLRSHHAFSMLTQEDGWGSIGIPARIHDGPTPSNATDSTFYPWLQSGLLRFELRGTSAADTRLVQMPSLIIQSSPQSYSLDSTVNGGRSVLFRNGAIYIGNGQFWRQDNAGNTFGPF